MPTEQQHDDHCYIVCEGVEWRIAAIRPGGKVLGQINSWNMPVFADIDLSSVDWPAYTAAAAHRLEHAA